MLVRDELTGEPLPGVTVSLYREEIENDAKPAPFVARFRTDRHGLLSIPWDQACRSCRV